MAPQSKASKRGGDEITESKPKKPRAPQRRKTTAADGKGGRQSKTVIKDTDPRRSSEDEAEAIEKPRFDARKMSKAEHCFPRFNNGDVYISLGDKRQYNYQLHGSVLIRASPWFDKSLNGDRPLEMDKALAVVITKKTKVEARYELRLTDDLSIDRLVRVSLTTTKNPEVFPTPEATLPPSSNRDTYLASQTRLPSVRQASRPTAALCQLDGHGSGTDGFYEDRSTIILEGPQKIVRAEDEEVAASSKSILQKYNMPAELVINKEVAEDEKLEATVAGASQEVDAKTDFKEEVARDENVKVEDAKNEDTKEGDIKNKDIKEEEVEEEVKTKAVKSEPIKVEDAKEENVEDEGLEQENIKKNDINRTAAVSERQVDATTTMAHLVGNEEGTKDIAANLEQQAGANTTRSEPAEEEEDGANALPSFSVLNEEPVLPAATTQATIKHEISEATVQLYQQVQSEPSQLIRKEKLTEREHDLGAVHPRNAEKIKTWPGMLRQAETNNKKPAKLIHSDHETAPAERAVHKRNHLNVSEIAANLKSKAQADTEPAKSLNKKRQAIQEEGRQNVATSSHDMDCNQTESNIKDVEMLDAISNEGPNEVALPHAVIDLTDTQSTAGQDEKMVGDMHAEGQTEVAEHSEPKPQPKIEPGERHAEIEGVIDEKLAADQKLSGDNHSLAPGILSSHPEAHTEVTRAEEASRMIILSKPKTETRTEAAEPAPTMMKEVNPKGSKASSPTPLKPTGPSEDLLEAYNNLFLTYYSQSPVIDASDIEVALKQTEQLVDVASIYGSLPIIRHHVNSCLFSFHRELYEAIARDPPRWVKLSILIESTPIFKEGIIHIVGTFPSWPSTTTQPEELGIKTNALIEHKISALDVLRNCIDRTLFLTSIRVNGKEVYLDKDNPSTLSTWFVVQVWRDWYTRSLSKANHRGDQKQNAIATMYRAIARAGDGYLPLNYVVELWEAFLHSKQSPKKATIEEIAEDLKLMKSFAQQAVQPLCVNNSILNVEETGIGYFTCANVECHHELPWLDAFALDDSMIP